MGGDGHPHLTRSQARQIDTFIDSRGLLSSVFEQFG